MVQPDTDSLARKVMADPVHWPAFGFGLGLLPKAPGTWGSLLGIPVYLLLQPFGMPISFGVALLMFVFGVWVCGESARRLGVHDHPGIVWDEVLGCLLTLTAAVPEPAWILTGFLLFRVADIWKPWPIRDMDHRLQGGLGIMVDDVMAAFYAALVLLLLRQFFP